MFVCAPGECSARGGQKKVLGPLELGLQVVSRSVGVRTEPGPR